MPFAVGKTVSINFMKGFKKIITFGLRSKRFRATLQIMKRITQAVLTCKHFLLPLFTLFFIKINAQTFTCLGSISVPLNENCQAEITPQLLVKGSNLGNWSDYEVALTFGPNPYPNNIVTAQDIYRAITARVTNIQTGGSCSTTIFTRDTIPPKAVSPQDTVIHCSQTNSYGTPLVVYSGEPRALAECSGGVKYTFTDQYFYATCFTPFTQKPIDFPSDLKFDMAKVGGCSRVTVRSFRVRDTFDNNTVVRQVIYMKDANYADVVYNINTVRYCNGTPLNTDPDTVLINGVKIAGTGRPFYKTFLPLTNGACRIQATWQDIQTILTNETKIIKRQWILTNPCMFRADTLTQTINIHDGVPTISCKPIQTYQIPTTKTLTVKAQNLIESVSDQCTPKDKLILGIKKLGDGTGFSIKDSLVFTCSDTLMHAVELWVKDEMGRTNVCTTALRIIDTLYICSPRPLSIEGKLNKENTTAVKAQVFLTELKTGLLAEQPLATDFKFTAIKREGTYKITPTRPKDWVNGVSTLDIALISRHILGIEPLTSPYKIIAADIDGDGEITAADMLHMRRLVLRKTDSVPNSQPWRFVPMSHVFANPEEALTYKFPQFLVYDRPTDNINNANFFAIKTGDVNLSARETTLLQAEVRGNAPSLNFTVKKDKQGDLVFSSDTHPIQGFQMTLNLGENMSNIESLESTGLKGFSDNNYALFTEKSKITISWNGKLHKGELFKIKLKARTTQPVDDILQITSDLVVTEAYSSDDEIRGIKMVVKEENSIKKQGNTEGGYLEILPNSPNPFSDETTLRFNLAENDTALISIFDNQGRLLKTVKKPCQKGYNELKISLFDVRREVQEGVLIYKIQTARETLVGRMVLVK
jgi:hypothetical protein